MSDSRDAMQTPHPAEPGRGEPHAPPPEEPRGLAAALAEFTRRLASFGLGAAQDPLLASRAPTAKRRPGRR